MNQWISISDIKDQKVFYYYIQCSNNGHNIQQYGLIFWGNKFKSSSGRFFLTVQGISGHSYNLGDTMNKLTLPSISTFLLYGNRDQNFNIVQNQFQGFFLCV